MKGLQMGPGCSTCSVRSVPRCGSAWRARRIACSAQKGAEKTSTPVASAALLASIGWFSSVSAALADQAVEASVSTSNNGFLAPIVDSLDFVLSKIEGVYLQFGIPYSYGWSIVTLTAFVKILTLPLTKKQVESAMAVQSLKPRVDAIKERYGEDKDKIQKETSRLYEQAGVNPLAGCLPSLATIPIFIGLYRSLSNVANSGALDAEGFYWVPSLAGPVSLAARNGGGGIEWLWPLVDGAPPIGWEEAAAYLVLPVLLVVAQYVSSAIISPVDPNDEKNLTQVLIVGALPLMIGWFSLNVPAGLSLYYFANSVFTSAQQIYFRKLGGAVVDTRDLGPVKKLGMGRRTGEVVVARTASALPDFGDGMDSLSAEFGGAPLATFPPLPSASPAAAPAAPASTNGSSANGLGNGQVAPAEDALSTRAKRKRRELLTQG